MRATSSDGDPGLILVHQSPPERSDAFFAKHAPNARVIADTSGALYDEFALGHGGFWELFGPVVWWRGFLAMLRGHFIGRMGADPLRMPGVFLVRGREVLWSHRARHAGDHPDFDQVRAALPVPTA